MSQPLEFARGRYARRLAVCIGINAYRSSGIGRLESAVSDAQRMCALLSAMGFAHAEFVEEAAATREGILDLLERRLPLETSAKDLVVIYFSGHGATYENAGYVIPIDGKIGRAETAISVQRLKESALRMRALHVFFMMDACFSGTILRRSAAADQVNRLAYWEAAAKQRVVQILTAGTAEQEVLETGGWGLFTKMVYTGLSGAADTDRDGVITLEELGTYAERKVGQVNRRQHPQWGTMDGEGTVLFWDIRHLPDALSTGVKATPIGRPLIRGMEKDLARIHQAMERREWARAEKQLRDLMLQHSQLELNLLLAEVYVEADTLGNATLIEAELRIVEKGNATPEEQRRMLDLRSRTERARRGPL